MLLIGDIHITSKRQQNILGSLRDFIDLHPDEQHIVFLGDYVYHFTYDRKALLGLFSFFVELYLQGKHIWVLAGNHDWIDEHFVFAEGKWSFDLLHQHLHGGSIRFLTHPEIVQIEGQDVLFFPFKYLPNDTPIIDTYLSLSQETHPGVIQSARANSLLHMLVDEWRGKNNRADTLTIIHHWYIVDTAFPGQQARFNFKSPGLSAHRLDQEDIRMLSGHLHQPFVYKNYCCVGSVWSTSPLEVNQIKYLFRWDGKSLQAHACHINPYISLEVAHQKVTKEILDDQWQQIKKNSIEHLQQGSWTVTVADEMSSFLLQETSLYIRSATVSYSELTEFVDETILHQLKDYKIKSTNKSFDVMMEQLQDSSMQLDQRISDWKILLQRFLQARYGSEYDRYYTLLQELKIL